MNKSSKLGLLTLIFVLAVFGFFTIAKADPPDSPYPPGKILNPTCAPTDTNCTVSVASSTWVNQGTYLYPTSTLWSVGIGTTTPQYKLDLQGDLRVLTSSTLGNVISGVWQGSAIQDAYINSAVIWNGMTPSSTQVIAGTNLTGGGALTGNVTLNVTTTPTFTTVNGVNPSSWLTSAITTSTGNWLGTWQFYNPSDFLSSSTPIGGGSITTSSPATAGYFPYWATGSTLTGTSSIFQSGLNVGIGTTTPSAFLTVQGSGTSTTPLFDVLTSSSISALYVASSGNVGIGTNTPAVKLNVYGTDNKIRLSYNSSVYADLSIGITGVLAINPSGSSATIFGNVLLYGSASPRYLTVESQQSVAALRLASDVGKQWDIATGATANTNDLTITQSADYSIPFLTIKSTGNVGIGTTTPSAFLTVQGSGTSTTPLFNVLTSSSISALHVASNGNVGIGTTAPSEKLSVNGNIIASSTGHSSIYINAGASKYAQLFWSVNGTNKWNAFNDYSNDNLQFRDASNNDVLVLKQGGNVGIGTTTPSGILTVASSSTGTALLTVLSSGNVGIGTTGPLSKLDVSGSVAIGAYAGVVAAPANGMSISGSVTIGTSTAPTTKLEVVGTTYGIRARTSATTGTNYAIIGDASAVGGTENYALYAAASGATTNKAITIAANNPGVGATNWAIYSESQAQSYFAGNVGIGTTTPGAKLQVSGLTNTQNGVIIATADNGWSTAGAVALNITNTGGAWEPTVELLKINDTGGTQFVIKGNGNVGIGTTGPYQQLAIQASAATPSIGFAQTTGGFLFSNETTGGLGRIVAGDAGGSGLWNDAYIKFQTHHTNVTALSDSMIIRAGNVGIGTTAPVTKLGIYGTDNTAVTDTTFWGYNFIGTEISNQSNTANTVSANVYAMGSARTSLAAVGGIEESTTLGALAFFTGGSGRSNTIPERMRIDSAGNVGIGATSALTAKLYVSSTDASIIQANGVLDCGYLAFTEVGVSKGMVGYSTNSTAPCSVFTNGLTNSMALMASADLQLGTGPTAKMTILYGGNVGIGTTTPATALSVVGTITQSTVKSCSLGLTTDATGAITGCSASDISLKKDISKLDLSALDIVNQLEPVSYQWISTSTRDSLVHAGFIAQDVEKVFPTAISYAGIDENGNILKGIDPNAMNALLVKSVQELNLKLSDIASTTIGSSGIIGNLVDQVKSALSSLGLVIENGVASVQKLVASIIQTQNLEIGSSQNPSGFTIYDKITKQPYCVTMENGEIIKTQGKCDSENPNDQGSMTNDNQTSDANTTTTSPADQTSTSTDSTASSTTDTTADQPPADQPPTDQTTTATDATPNQ